MRHQAGASGIAAPPPAGGPSSNTHSPPDLIHQKFSRHLQGTVTRRRRRTNGALSPVMRVDRPETFCRSQAILADIFRRGDADDAPDIVLLDRVGAAGNVRRHAFARSPDGLTLATWVDATGYTRLT